MHGSRFPSRYPPNLLISALSSTSNRAVASKESPYCSDYIPFLPIELAPSAPCQILRTPASRTLQPGQDKSLDRPHPIHVPPNWVSELGFCANAQSMGEVHGKTDLACRNRIWSAEVVRMGWRHEVRDSDGGDETDEVPGVRDGTSKGLGLGGGGCNWRPSERIRCLTWWFRCEM